MPGFDEGAWEEFVDEFKSTPGAMAIGLGDYGDFLRPSMAGKLYGTLSQDDSAKRQVDDMVRRTQDKLLDKLQFLEGKLIGLHDGHHQWNFADGSNSTQRICSALKAPYLGWMASTRLVLSPRSAIKRAKNKERAPGQVYTIISMHGSGSARAATTDARWLEANIVPAFVADIYAKGHSCKSVAWSPFSRMHIRRRGEIGVDEVLTRCLNVGGFHRGYTNGWDSSYVERAGFSPQATAWAVCRFKLDSGKHMVGEKLQQHAARIDVEHLSRFPKCNQQSEG